MEESFLHELNFLDEVLLKYGNNTEVKVLGQVSVKGQMFPIKAIEVGSSAAGVPCLGVFAGVHGLENVGSHLAINFLRTVLRRMQWDKSFRSTLKKTRIAFIPIINPGGMYLRTRSNPNGVDLMRNAPVDSKEISFWQIFAGHRISNKIPWFRGENTGHMEHEAKVTVDYTSDLFDASSHFVGIDLHSGFGARDRLWFPWASKIDPFPHLAQVYALLRLYRKTYPNYVYKIEPQSKSYLAHGDLWDYMCEMFYARDPSKVFIPLCLEMGSWNWIKKNPIQALSTHGIFNPILPHRYKRAMRRHIPLLEFLLQATYSSKNWVKLKDSKYEKYEGRAHGKWYEDISTSDEGH